MAPTPRPMKLDRQIGTNAGIAAAVRALFATSSGAAEKFTASLEPVKLQLRADNATDATIEAFDEFVEQVLRGHK